MARSLTEIGMLEENTVIFLVNADCILDGVRLAISGIHVSVINWKVERRSNLLCDKSSIQVLNRSLAITSHGELISHISGAVLTQIKRVFAVMWVIRVTIRYNHLRK